MSLQAKVNVESYNHGKTEAEREKELVKSQWQSRKSIS